LKPRLPGCGFLFIYMKVRSLAEPILRKRICAREF
jgi:hypothetical protein